MLNKRLINPYKLVYFVTNWQGNMKSQSITVPSLTVRMRCSGLDLDLYFLAIIDIHHQRNQAYYNIH